MQTAADHEAAFVQIATFATTLRGQGLSYDHRAAIVRSAVESFGLPMCRCEQPWAKGYRHRLGSPCIRL